MSRAGKRSSRHRKEIKLVEEVLVKFSGLTLDFSQLKGMDINPLLVDGEDMIALDARIIIDKANAKQHFI